MHAQEKLAAGSLVDRVALGARTELGAQGEQLLVLGAAAHQGFAEATVQAVSEVVGREGGELREEGGVADDSRKEVSLALEPSLQHARRRLVGQVDARLPRRSRGREAREGLARQVEPVCEQPERILPLGGVLHAREDLAGADEGLLPVVRPLELDPHAVLDVALGPAEARRERVRASAGSSPFGSATTRTSNPCRTASSMPRSVASWPAASASKQRKTRLVSRPSSRSWPR